MPCCCGGSGQARPMGGYEPIVADVRRVRTYAAARRSLSIVRLLARTPMPSRWLFECGPARAGPGVGLVAVMRSSGPPSRGAIEVRNCATARQLVRLVDVDVEALVLGAGRTRSLPQRGGQPKAGAGNEAAANQSGRHSTRVNQTLTSVLQVSNRRSGSLAD